MKLNHPKEWFERSADIEAGQTIGAGCPAAICSPVASVRELHGRSLLRFHPPGYVWPIELPVITSGGRDGTGCWTWNGSLEKPTLRPSIKSTHPTRLVSHIWLNDGECQYLDDSTDGNAGKTLPLIPLENNEGHRTG